MLFYACSELTLITFFSMESNMPNNPIASEEKNIASEQQRLTALVEQTLAQAKRMGATAAEVAVSMEKGFSVNVRMGEPDMVEHHNHKGIAIGIYVGQQKGSASTSDIANESITETLQKAFNIARFTSPDPYAGLADKELMAFDYPDLDLFHPWALTPAEAIEIAQDCEAKGRAFDKRITNSEGASVSSHDLVAIYGNSHGFIGGFPASRHGVSLALIAQDGASMQRDFSYTAARDPLDLVALNKVAEEAASKAVRRLNAKRLSTRKAPVIFIADIADGLLSCFIAAIRGSSLYRNASFLLDHLGKAVFPEHITLRELPHIKKGLASAPFDGEGVKTRESDILKDGILQRYVLGAYSARKLGMQTTGNAGGVHNAVISTSDKDLAGLLKHMDKGLLVTELMGQGVNIVTGNYSRGASGFWVENGKIQYPVEEITIAGNLKNMFAHLILVGNDVDRRGSIHTGSILLDEMMIAGE